MIKQKKYTSVSSILFATFSPWQDNRRAATNGMIDPFYHYFLPRISTLDILDQPYPGSDRIFPIVESYQKAKKRNEIKISFLATLISPLLLLENKPGTRLSFKLRDFVSVLEAGFRTQHHELFIGLESINTLAGIVLRKLGRIKLVVYYVSDYSPKRFSIKILNDVYLWLDKYCAEHSDFIWDVSKAIHPARIQAGLDPTKSAPVIYVPNALFPEQIESIPFSSRQKNSVVFMGTLGLENGPDLAIEAFAMVLSEIPDAKLHIIGGGGKGFEQKHLQDLSRKLKIEKSVVFHGFISDVKKISSMIKHFQIALAPYKMIPGSIRLYGDATKIRQYLAAGLPIITTYVPPLGKEAKKYNAAIIVRDSKKDLARAVLQLLKDEKKCEMLAKNALSYAENNTWDNTYKNAMKTMMTDLQSTSQRFRS